MQQSSYDRWSSKFADSKHDQQQVATAPGVEHWQATYPGEETHRPWWKQRKSIRLFVCWLIGIAVAIAHHFFYRALHGTVATNQAVSRVNQATDS